MTCDEARRTARDAQAGRLSEASALDRAAHLETCAACRHEDAAEAALTDALARRLVRRKAPPSLVRRLEDERRAAPSQAQAGQERSRRPLPWRAAALALSFGLAAAASVAIYYERVALPNARERVALTTEAVNDHLRLLYSEHPLEVESGGIHQVKPWFSGKLDFAPLVAFAGDDEFPLQGGAVSYFFDRKAATFVFKRRLHTISLFVFRAEGLPWAASGLVSVGHVMALPAHSRGFNVLLWRDRELGYALVSDVDPTELLSLAARVSP
jgi:anti-sigma factor RsiW